MNISTLLRSGLVSAAAVLHLSTFDSQAFTISLQEQGGLTGVVSGGGGSVIINPMAMDHWKVTVLDPRIGNPLNPSFNLAFVEPETVANLTAYNNVQVLSVSPGTLVFDVLSDEFSPYMNIAPNGSTSPFQNTDIDMVSLKFMDFADSVPEPGSASVFLIGGVLALLKRLPRQRSSR
jgi:hypothetical protein